MATNADAHATTVIATAATTAASGPGRGGEVVLVRAAVEVVMRSRYARHCSAVAVLSAAQRRGPPTSTDRGTRRAVLAPWVPWLGADSRTRPAACLRHRTDPCR